MLITPGSERVKRSPTGDGRLIQVRQIRGIIKTIHNAILCHNCDFMCRISLKNATYFDFWGEIWIKNYLK